jgi:hypothetical protein
MKYFRGCFAAFAWLASSSAFAERIYTSARLSDGEQSFEALLRLPKLEPGTYTVYCELVVRTNGKIAHMTCYAGESLPEHLDGLPRSVAKSARLARLIPATRDGKAVEAFMLITVRIHVTGSGPQVLVVPNNGADAKRYGLLYTAPQRINEFEFRRRVGCKDNCVVWMRMEIDERGKVVTYNVDRAGNPDSSLYQELERQIQRMEFIPGRYEGKPVPMTYVEPLYNLWD